MKQQYFLFFLFFIHILIFKTYEEITLYFCLRKKKLYIFVGVGRNEKKKAKERRQS
jgi:hypothetical protein